MTNEELKQAAEVMLAAAEGAAIQVKNVSGLVWADTNPSDAGWNWNHFTYRIKPTKTLRPWKPEEVPLGAQTRIDEVPQERDMIVGVNSIGVLLANDSGSYPFKDLLELREYSIDGGVTWKPCGVEVES